MHAIRALLSRRLAAVAVVAIVATGGAIAAVAAAGGSHQKAQLTALSVKHTAMRPQKSCEGDDQVASRETASREAALRDDDAGQPTKDDAKGSCGSERSERLGDSKGSNDRDDAAEANGNRDSGRPDETQQQHQASGQD